MKTPYIDLVITLAYLDPGAGSYIIQMVIAAIIGGGILLRSFWEKLFRKKSDRDDDTESQKISKEDE